MGYCHFENRQRMGTRDSLSWKYPEFCKAHEEYKRTKGKKLLIKSADFTEYRFHSILLISKGKTVFSAWFSRNVVLTMIFIVCEHFSENIFSTKFVLRNKHTRFFISDMHISTCRLDFGESNEVSCFRLGLSQCFCLVVQSKFHELCCECILRHKLCRICVKVRGDTLWRLMKSTCV